MQDSSPLEDTSIEQWQDWVDRVKASEAIWWEQITKSRKKIQVNLRDRLFELEVNEPPKRQEQGKDSPVVLRYIGSCRNDGTLLRVEHLVYMLEQVTGLEFQLLHAHRSKLMLNFSSPPASPASPASPATSA